MDKHTFKVGDLVTCHDVTSLCPDGTKAVVVDVKNGYGGVQIWINSLDERFRDVNGYFQEKEVHDYLKHDTNLQVGDWVRYEGVAENYIASLEGHVGTITEAHSDSARVRFPGITDVFLTANIVKIQPPQKDSDDTIIHVFTSYTNKEEKKMRKVFSITHEKYGVVEGVHQVAPGCYCKNGAYYYHGEGWRETEEWVKIEVRKNEWATVVKSLGIITVNKKAHDGTIYLSTIGWRPVK